MLRTFPLFVLLMLLLPFARSGAQEQKLPDGPGKDVFVRTCSGCHGPQIVIGRGNNEDGWTQVVMNMIQRGAQGSEDDFAQIVQYLSKNFPPGGSGAAAQPAAAAAKVNVNTATAGGIKTGLALTDKEAQAIVDYRQQHGPFKVLDDLKKVPDVDAKKVDAKKDVITF